MDLTFMDWQVEQDHGNLWNNYIATKQGNQVSFIYVKIHSCCGAS